MKGKKNKLLKKKRCGKGRDYSLWITHLKKKRTYIVIHNSLFVPDLRVDWKRKSRKKILPVQKAKGERVGLPPESTESGILYDIGVRDRLLGERKKRKVIMKREAATSRRCLQKEGKEESS